MTIDPQDNGANGYRAQNGRTRYPLCFLIANKSYDRQQTDADSIGKFLHELDIRIRARYPLIAINTYEEDRGSRALNDLVFQDSDTRRSLYISGVVDRPAKDWSIQRKA